MDKALDALEVFTAFGALFYVPAALWFNDAAWLVFAAVPAFLGVVIIMIRSAIDGPEASC